MSEFHRETGFLERSDKSRVPTLLVEPDNAKALYVFAHGAGAGYQHRLMESAALSLATHGIASLRYQFPYMELGSRRPDPLPVLLKTVERAVLAASKLRPELPLFAGGRSMGGRMTSQAQARSPLPGVRGIVFLAFPLHPAPKKDTAPEVTEDKARGRAEHLAQVEIPMLFVNGTRDKLARPDLLGAVVAGHPQATLCAVEGADHSFSVLKRSGRTSEEVESEIAASVATFMAETSA